MVVIVFEYVFLQINPTKTIQLFIHFANVSYQKITLVLFSLNGLFKLI